MKHVIGIGLLVVIACMFKWWIHSNVSLAYEYGRTLRATPVNVVVSWILLGIAAMWALVMGLAFVFDHRRPL